MCLPTIQIFRRAHGLAANAIDANQPASLTAMRADLRNVRKLSHKQFLVADDVDAGGKSVGCIGGSDIAAHLDAGD